MDQPQFYSKNNDMQKRDAVFVIENFLRLTKWKDDDRLLDIGCGDGEVLMKFLLPTLPTKDFSKVIGVDISQDMVNFARKTYQDDTRIRFEKMNISAEEVPKDFREEFQHVFSHYCLHWITDQRLAFKNIYKMLKPGGDILLAFLGSNPVYDIYETMARNPKWTPYMLDVDQYISPYHHSTQPGKELENILTEEGFVRTLCKVEDRTFVFPSFSTLEKATAAINPFIGKLPNNKVDEYKKDLSKEIRNLKNICIETYNNNNNDEERDLNLTHTLVSLRRGRDKRQPAIAYRHTVLGALSLAELGEINARDVLS